MVDITYEQESKHDYNCNNVQRDLYLDIHRSDTIIGIKDNQVNIIKSRYMNPKNNLSFEDVESLALDLICRGLEIYEVMLFSESFKQEFKDKLKELIDEYRVK